MNVAGSCNYLARRRPAASMRRRRSSSRSHSFSLSATSTLHHRTHLALSENTTNSTWGPASDSTSSSPCHHQNNSQRAHLAGAQVPPAIIVVKREQRPTLDASSKDRHKDNYDNYSVLRGLEVRPNSLANQQAAAQSIGETQTSHLRLRVAAASMRKRRRRKKKKRRRRRRRKEADEMTDGWPDGPPPADQSRRSKSTAGRRQADQRNPTNTTTIMKRKSNSLSILKLILIFHILRQYSGSLDDRQVDNMNQSHCGFICQHQTAIPWKGPVLVLASASESAPDYGDANKNDRRAARLDELLTGRMHDADHEEIVRPIDLIKRTDYQQPDESAAKISQQHERPRRNHRHQHHRRHSSQEQQQPPALTQHHRHRHYHRRENSLPLNKPEPQTQSSSLASSAERRSKRHNLDDNNDNNNSYNFETNLSGADRPLVTTKKGRIRGITQRVFTGKYVDAFLGIPFAQPPRGKYRFKHPQPVNPWKGELDASRMSSSCYQVNDTFFGSNFMGTSVWNANTPLDEDCLYLNIWAPMGVANASVSRQEDQFGSGGQRSQKAASSDSARRAVLVWIFGGGFYSGTSTLSLYEGGVLASEEDIIVVSLNYRVSALGFLYFGRPDAPGNSGLFDQLVALQWINDNIDQFGGDPSRVTIFGESAGAVSVAFHLLSPLSRNLFSQAILQSGAATCPWGFMETREIMANGLQLAQALNCPSNQSDLDVVIDCLLKANPMELVSQEVGQTKSVINFPFVPVVDGSFLIESPYESLSKSNFKPARLLLGSNYDEGNSFLIYLSEFSNCPSSSAGEQSGDFLAASAHSGGQDNGKQTAAPATMTNNYKSSNLSDDEEPNNNMANGDGDADEPKRSGPAGGRATQLAKLERLDLVASSSSSSSARRTAQSMLNSQQQQQQQNQPSKSNASGGGGGEFGAAGQQQQIINSKPCKPIEYLSLQRDDFRRVLREDLNPYAEQSVVKEAILFEYSNWNNPNDSLSNYDALDKIVGDYHFTCHVNEFARHYAETGNQVFMYYFRQRSSISPWPKWMGVLHGDEINFIFGEPLNQSFNYTAKEVELSRRMMKYWANFAKFGNPTRNGENSTMEEKWPEYVDKRQYFELHSEYMRIGRGPRAKQCAFWFQYLPGLIHSLDNYQCESNSSSASALRVQNYGLFQMNSIQQQHQYGRMPFKNVPSALLLGLFVIVALVLLTIVYVAFSSHRDNGTLSSRLANIWPSSCFNVKLRKRNVATPAASGGNAAGGAQSSRSARSASTDSADGAANANIMTGRSAPASSALG